MRRVVIGQVGTTLDRARPPVDRWERWRPTVALCQHEDLLIDRFELLHAKRDQPLLEQIREDLARVSPETQVVPRLFEPRDPWDFEEVYGALHDFASAYAFDLENEQYLLHLTTGTHVFQICLFLLAESRHFPARLLQASPPARSNERGPGRYTVTDLDLSQYDRIAQRFHREQREGLAFLKAGIDTRDPAFNRLIERIEEVAGKSREPILLLGPTGAGKSRLARRIYELKKQRRQVAGRFVELNCATLRGDLSMSTLFGHRRGAFTGAQQDRPGLLKTADGGLLFLDEIGELGLDEQAMLLRALEEKKFLPLGGDDEQGSDFQLITGTNRDLPEAVEAGRFRADLLARLDLWTFRLPGLAERRDDIEPNLRWELTRRAAATGNNLTLSREAEKRFLDFARAPAATWKGNFRDLDAAVTRMATLAPAGRITVAEVEEEIQRLETAWSAGQKKAAPETEEDEALLLEVLGEEKLAEIDDFDRVQLAHVIRVCRRSRSLAEAGRALFAASRRQKAQPNDADRLRKYLLRFGLAFASFSRPPCP
jgi:transcriptional regulatory protein RtcR